MDQPILLIADRIVTMAGPVLRDTAILISNGRIRQIGPAKELSRANFQTMERNNCTVLPGLINAHVHLELSNCCAGDDPGGSFTDWILSIRDRMKVSADNPEQSLIEATQSGVQQCLRFGVTAIGDISQSCHVTRMVLKDGPLSSISFGEVMGYAALQYRLPMLMERALDESHTSPYCRIGITPHAPYTVTADQYRQCLKIAQEKNLPLATHLAETLDESLFLEHQTGPFRAVYDTLESWEPTPFIPQRSPIAFAKDVGLLDYPSLLAHVNFCNDAELDLLAKGKASVIYCPRTHRYFGHPRHRWREMLSRGINVCIGTDSCASSPNLNIVDDLRLLHEMAPHFPIERLWQTITVNAAKALRMPDAGTIEVGKSADFAIFPVTGSDPLREILESSVLPTQTWSEGKRVK